MRRVATALCLGLALSAPLAPRPAVADDRDWLTAFLEDNLSGAGRKVTITGFAGALSSRATIERLTIADDEGVWIALDNVVLDWSRSALLSGALVVNELTADRITLERLPETAPADPALPAPEATPFTLPELPVSVDIGTIASPRIVLGAPVLGEPVEASLAAALHLADGSGTASLDLERIDSGPAAKVTLQAGLVDATSALTLALDAHEAPGGIVSRLIGLPGQPELGLTLSGRGTADDFTGSFRLATDGEDRLAGPLTVKAEVGGVRSFAARLRGNPAPLFVPEYAGFLGDSLAVDVKGQLFPDGRLQLDRLDLAARALQLEGSLALAADGLPERIDISGLIADPSGQPLLLPLPGPVEIRIDRAGLSLRFDAAAGSGWRGQVTLEGLARADFSARYLALTGGGTIDRQQGLGGVDGTLGLAAAGLAPADPALATALGQEITGNLGFAWRSGTAGLGLPALEIRGADYRATAALVLEGLDSGLTAAGRIALAADDLSRFAALAGRPLGGAGEVTVEGRASALSGAFDLVLGVNGEGLRTGIAEADHLLAGRATIDAALRRDTDGITLREFELRAASLLLKASGTLASAGSAITGEIDWASLADLGRGFGGSLNARLDFQGTPAQATLTLDGAGRGLRSGQAEVDRLIGGDSTLAATLAIRDGVPMLKALRLIAPNLSATVAGEGGTERLRVEARLRDLALVAPGFPGPLTLAGTLAPAAGADWRADLALTGPGNISARLAGTLGTRPDLTLNGTASAALANGLADPVVLAGTLGYDLALRGGWAPASLSGRVTLADGRIAVPARGLSLQQVAGAAGIGGGRVDLTVSAGMERGGRLRLSGPVAMSAPFAADLDLRLEGVRLRDPELYDTTIDGRLTLAGNLRGAARLAGNLALGQTELRVPSTGMATAADIAAVRHEHESAAVRATRARAGVNGHGGGEGAGRTDGAGGLPDWALDLTIDAPRRVFIRGRGLDAELGGAIRVAGTLRQPVPAGGLELVRGRLDILGKRLTLTEAGLRLEGDFVPWLAIAAANTTEGVTSIVRIDGRADRPEVTFTSEPEMAQEEVLAWLLFGHGLDRISPFQAAQLAGAVATLAGRGGEGIVGKLRRGFGLDDLDISADDNGAASVSAGKYISERVYTEVGVAQDGSTRINLNYDVRPGVTVKGRVDSTGSSGIGIYLERDY